MAKTVIGLFEHMQDAQGALTALQEAGLPRNAITFVQQAEPELNSRLVSIGIPEQDAGIYMQGVQQGNGLIVVQGVADGDAEQAADIIDRYNAVDISRRKQSFQRMSLDRSTTSVNTGRANTNLYQGDEVALPIIQEELRIGKRIVDRGGVRIRTRVEEIPVQQQVTLREEHVNIQRRPVNRPVSPATLDTFQEGMIEIRESAEEAVVAKEARIVEEVLVRKQAEERVETVQDTVRRTDVDIEQVPGQMRTSGTTTTATGSSAAGNEGIVERSGSILGNAAERLTGTDLNRDGDVGRRDPRNNI